MHADLWGKRYFTFVEAITLLLYRSLSINPLLFRFIFHVLPFLVSTLKQISVKVLSIDYRTDYCKWKRTYSYTTDTPSKPIPDQ